jgi:hypothetical protein
MGEFMDKVIKVALGLFIVILVVFVSIVSYMTYVDTMYRDSLSSNYEYSCTISTEGVLSNVTLFLPVPADIQGNSPVIAKISSQDISGVPANWNLTLFDTGKGTLLQVAAPVIGQSPANGSAQPVTVSLTVNVSSPALIDTASPVAHAAVFRPVQNIQMVSCPADAAAFAGNLSCYQYQTSIYADYTAAPTASLAISSGVTGTNSWTIFSPASNGFRNTLSVPTLHGANHGWVTAVGGIVAGIGSYDVPST